MGTQYSVQLAEHVDSATYEKVSGAIAGVLNDVNAKMSTYIDTSEVSRFAAAPPGEPFELSEDTVTVIRKALELSEASGGAFDITVRPLVDAWGFGPDGRPERRPGGDTTQALLERVGYRKLKLDVERRTLLKTTASVSVDLSAIAKGYAVDRVADTLEELGYENYLVEIGGEMRVRGEKAPEQPWRVGIEAPVPGERKVARVVRLTDHGMATSGNYRNFYIEDGIRYAHTIDPTTGEPVRHRLQSVSVIHPESALADGWATALMVLGEKKAPQVASENGLAALFIISGPEGRFEFEMTDPFRAFLIEEGGAN